MCVRIHGREGNGKTHSHCPSLIYRPLRWPGRQRRASQIQPVAESAEDHRRPQSCPSRAYSGGAEHSFTSSIPAAARDKASERRCGRAAAVAGTREDRRMAAGMIEVGCLEAKSGRCAQDARLGGVGESAGLLLVLSRARLWVPILSMADVQRGSGRSF